MIARIKAAPGHMVRIPSAILPRKLLPFDKWTEVEWDSYWARLEGRNEIIIDKPVVVVAVPVSAAMAPAFAQGKPEPTFYTEVDAGPAGIEAGPLSVTHPKPKSKNKAKK